MQGPRRQLFAGSALALNQYRRIGGRHSLQELVNIFHARAFAHQAAILTDFHRQPLIFLFQPLQPASILQRNRRDACNRCHQMQMVVR